MAEELESMPDTARKTGRTSKYDWDLWLNGKCWRIVEGEDFLIPAANFAAGVYQAARRLNKVATIRKDTLDPKVLYIQATPDPNVARCSAPDDNDDDLYKLNDDDAT